MWHSQHTQQCWSWLEPKWSHHVLVNGSHLNLDLLFCRKTRCVAAWCSILVRFFPFQLSRVRLPAAGRQPRRPPGRARRHERRARRGHRRRDPPARAARRPRLPIARGRRPRCPPRLLGRPPEGRGSHRAESGPDGQVHRGCVCAKLKNGRPSFLPTTA